MIRRLLQHLRSILCNPARYLVVTRRIRRTDWLRRRINARQGHATIGLGIRPSLRWKNYDTQMAQIREMERGFSLPGLTT